MTRARTESGGFAFKFACFLLLFVALVACRLGASSDSETRNNRNSKRDSSSSSSRSAPQDGPNAELCRKYESCGCETFDKCMSALANDPNIDTPGLRECMLNSSCQSLCAANPDGCKGNKSGTGTGSGTRSNCAAISCSKNSDCPADCYGGCDGVRCYSF